MSMCDGGAGLMAAAVPIPAQLCFPIQNSSAFKRPSHGVDQRWFHISPATSHGKRSVALTRYRNEASVFCMLMQHQASGECSGPGMAAPPAAGSDVPLRKLREVAGVFTAFHRSSLGPARDPVGVFKSSAQDAPSSTAPIVRDITQERIQESKNEWSECCDCLGWDYHSSRRAAR